MSEKTENDNQLALIKLIDEDQKTAVPMAINEKQGLSGVMAKDADPDDLRLVVKVSFMKAVINNKRSVVMAEASMVINNIRDEILRAYGSIRLGEIGLAMHKASMGEYEKVYNLSMAFFIQGIRTYMQSERRSEEVKKMLASSQNQLLLSVPEPSPEEKIKTEKQLINNAFQTFKSKGGFNDYGNYIFILLTKYGVVNFTEQDRIDIWKKARHNVYQYYTRVTTDMDRRFENKRVVAELNANKDHDFFYTEAKKIALNKLFYDLREMDNDINELIEA